MKSGELNKQETTTYTKSKGVILSGKYNDNGEIIRVVDYVNQNLNDQDHGIDQITEKVEERTATVEPEVKEAFQS